MSMLAKSLDIHFRNHVRGGGKETRRKEVSRMIEFLEFAETYEGVRTLQSLGKKQVIGFWKSHRDLSYQTAYKYWLAIRKIWEWSGKIGLPPEPFKKVDIAEKTVQIDATQSAARYSNIGMAIKAVCEKQGISPGMLANMTGIMEYEILDMIDGNYSESLNYLQTIFTSLKIVMTLESQ